MIMCLTFALHQVHHHDSTIFFHPAHALVALYSCVAIMFMKTILVRYKMHYNVGWNIQDNWLEFVINVNCCASRCQIVHGS